MSSYYMVYDSTGKRVSAIPTDEFEEPPQLTRQRIPPPHPLDRGFEHEETVEDQQGPSYQQNIPYLPAGVYPNFEQVTEVLEESYQSCNFCNYPVQAAEEGDRCPICYYPIKIKRPATDKCAICDFPTDGPENMEAHLEGVHSSISENDAVMQFCLRWDPKGYYQCPFCVKGKICVKDSRMLCQHMSQHHIVKIRELYIQLLYLHDVLNRSFDPGLNSFVCPFGCAESHESMEPFKVHLQLEHKTEFVQLVSDLELSQLMLEKYGVKTAPDQFPRQYWPSLTEEDLVAIRQQKHLEKWTPVKRPGKKGLLRDVRIATVDRGLFRIQDLKHRSPITGKALTGKGLKVIRRSYDPTKEAETPKSKTPAKRGRKRKEPEAEEGEEGEGDDEEPEEAESSSKKPKPQKPLRRWRKKKQLEEEEAAADGEKVAEEEEGGEKEVEEEEEGKKDAELEPETGEDDDISDSDDNHTPFKPPVVRAPVKATAGLYSIRKKYTPPEDEEEEQEGSSKKKPRARKTVGKRGRGRPKKADDEDYEPSKPAKARKSISPKKKKQDEGESESNEDEPQSSSKAKKAQPRTLKQAREASAKKKGEPQKKDTPPKMEMRKRTPKKREMLNL